MCRVKLPRQIGKILPLSSLEKVLGYGILGWSFSSRDVMVA